ncbi:MAG TPA: glycosyltransferase family 2 protein [Aggregatilineales bacterium]|nr:glycosyltransferase family 2 protein [Aggregatilineales bacterium]
MSARNAAPFIAETIESVLNQSFADFEFLMVSNASTDDTGAIMQQYAARDARISVIQHPVPGWTAAVNKAMRAAKSAWIARIDADDVMLPNRLERQWRAIQQEPDVILWGSYAYQINLAGEVVGSIEHGPTTREEFNARLKTGEPVFILNPTTIFRKDIALACGGFDETLVAAGDEELWDRMRVHGPMLVIPEKLIKYRVHSGSLTAAHARTQALVHRFIIARATARNAGRELTLAQFTADRQRRPWYDRLNEYRFETGRILYRRSGSHLLTGRKARGALELIGAAVVAPHFTISRLWSRYRRGRGST